MAWSSVQGGWAQAFTCAQGCWPVISSPSGMKKKGCCFLSVLRWGSPHCNPIPGYGCDLPWTLGWREESNP